jgi:hypothetical protein
MAPAMCVIHGEIVKYGFPRPPNRFVVPVEPKRTPHHLTKRCQFCLFALLQQDRTLVYPRHILDICHGPAVWQSHH